MNKWLIIAIALSLSPLAHAMEHDLPVGPEQGPKRLKVESEHDEMQAARAFVQAELAKNRSALHEACERVDIDTVRMFVKARMNIMRMNRNGRIPLHYIHVNYHDHPRECAEIARLLLMHDASRINIRDREGYTLLHLAAREGAIDLVNIYTKFGANINLRHEPSRKSVLHLALQYPWEEPRNITLKRLLRSGAEVDAKDRHGATPLHYAAFYGYYNDAIPTLIIEAGAQYLLDHANKGPLHYVFKKKIEEEENEEGNWREIVQYRNCIKHFDRIFVTLLRAFPEVARESFTIDDCVEAERLLDDCQDFVDSLEEHLSDDEFQNHPCPPSMEALDRAVEILDNPELEKIELELAGERLREKLLSLAAHGGSIITALNNSAVGKTKITNNYFPCF